MVQINKITNERCFEDSLLRSAKFEREYKQGIIKILTEELKGLPEGTVTQRLINGKQYLYRTLKNKNPKKSYNQKYIRKSDSKLAMDLIRKKFIRKSLVRLKEDVAVISKFIDTFTPYNSNIIISKMAIDTKRYPDAFKTKEDAISAWQSEPYEKGKMYADALKNTSIGGVKVRSKSEATIANLLEVNKVPFRYEAKLQVGYNTYFPDFTILKPRDGRVLYWEHFGMINDPEYNLKIERKLTEYKRIGLIPWVDYISTYDDDNGSLNTEIIKKLIETSIL